MWNKIKNTKAFLFASGGVAVALFVYLLLVGLAIIFDGTVPIRVFYGLSLIFVLIGGAIGLGDDVDA